MDDLLALLVVGAFVVFAFLSQRKTEDARENAALRELIQSNLQEQDRESEANRQPSVGERTLVWYDPMRLAPADARPLVSGLLQAMRSVESLRGFSEAVTPSVLEELRAAIESVVAYSVTASPETASGRLETRLYDVAPHGPESFEARVFIGTPFTQASDRAASIIRHDLLLGFRLVDPSECEQCGAPLGEGPTCQFCGSRTGECRWRVVRLQPARPGASTLTADRGSFVGYRMPERAVPVQVVN